jgi:molybdate transport system substrate-binding protein
MVFSIMKRILLFASLIFFIFVFPAFAQEKITVAVASNFIGPFKEIISLYEAKTGVHIDGTYASTGQLYAQITNGAPYDLFLSADRENPNMLNENGLAEPPFVYATGTVVLWTNQKELCKSSDWRTLLSTVGPKKIAIANPKTAPYGAAAMEALKKAGLTDIIQEKLVFAQNIAQSFQYAFTGSVDAGFCALSSALSDEGQKGCYLTISEAPPIVQSACLLKRTPQKKTAEEFVRFLSSPAAETIKKKYGYR